MASEASQINKQTTVPLEMTTTSLSSSTRVTAVKKNCVVSILVPNDLQLRKFSYPNLDVVLCPNYNQNDRCDE